MAIHPIFDTNSVITHRSEIEGYFHSLYFPSIVFFELVSTSIDKSTLDLYSQWHRELKKVDRILTPTENDWWETARTMRRLYVTKATDRSKLTTLRSDALIARLVAKQKDAFLVTDDIDDFQIIKREMNELKVISAEEFFA